MWFVYKSFNNSIALMQQRCRKNLHRIMRTFVPFVNTVRTTGVLRNQLHPAVLHVVDVRILCGLTSDESLYCTSAYDSTLVWDLIPDDIEQLGKGLRYGISWTIYHLLMRNRVQRNLSRFPERDTTAGLTSKLVLLKGFNYKFCTGQCKNHTKL